MIKLDFNRDLIGVNNKPIYEINQDGQKLSDKPIKLNEFLANQLGNMQKGGLKYFNWAIKLYDTGIIEMDEVDLKGFEENITNMNLSNIIVGRILEVIEGAKTLTKN